MLWFGVLITTKGFTAQMLPLGNREAWRIQVIHPVVPKVWLRKVLLTETFFVFCGVFPVYFMISFTSIK